MIATIASAIINGSPSCSGPALLCTADSRSCKASVAGHCCAIGAAG